MESWTWCVNLSFINDMTNKGLICKIHKQLIQHNIKKQTSQKRAEDLNGYSLPKCYNTLNSYQQFLDQSTLLIMLLSRVWMLHHWSNNLLSHFCCFWFWMQTFIPAFLFGLVELFWYPFFFNILYLEVTFFPLVSYTFYFIFSLAYLSCFFLDLKWLYKADGH